MSRLIFIYGCRPFYWVLFKEANLCWSNFICSISGRRRADAHIHTHKVYHHHHTHAQNPKTPKQVNDNELDRQTWDSTTTEVENREGDGNFIIRDRQYPLPHKIQRRDEEYTITYVPLKVERSRMEEEPVPEVFPIVFKQSHRFSRTFLVFETSQ